MIKSMTGFGQASAKDALSGSPIEVGVQIRTVNSRYLKLNIGAPQQILSLEAKLASRLKEAVSRGSVLVDIDWTMGDVGRRFVVDGALLEYYLHSVRGVAGEETSVDVGCLLSLPGCVREEKESLSEEERNIVIEVFKKALEQLIASRLVEGEAIAEDLEKSLNRLQNCTESVKNLREAVVRDYRDRLKKRVAALLKDVSADAISQAASREAVLYAERSDINEELQRLETHINQFRKALADTVPVGRQLEFIAQEMLRESNTLLSKAPGTRLLDTLLSMKTEIDKIREQVQNVE